MEIQDKEIESLIPYARNARTHSQEQISQIAASIKEFGFNNPILTDGENGVIAGHGRLLAAIKLGIETVPTIELSHMSDNQKRAYILADNKIALNAGWDEFLLKSELMQLNDDNFNIDVLGFEDKEINDILFDLEVEGEIEKNETIYEQSIQLEPTKEYIIAMCDNFEDFENLRLILKMGYVRRGGYKKESSFDSVGPERVINAKYLIERLKNVNSNTE